MRDYFLHLFRYNEWANKRLFLALPEVVDRDPSTLRLFSHLVAAERLWLSRVKGTGESFKIWEPLPLPELVKQINLSAEQWISFLERAGDHQFRSTIDYLNLKGQPYSNSLAEIAAHTVNHSTHHRGQIVLLIRKQDIASPILDLIAFARKE